VPIAGNILATTMRTWKRTCWWNFHV